MGGRGAEVASSSFPPMDLTRISLPLVLLSVRPWPLMHQGTPLIIVNIVKRSGTKEGKGEGEGKGKGKGARLMPPPLPPLSLPPACTQISMQTLGDVWS